MAKEEVSHLLMIGQLKSGPETRHKLPLSSDAEHLLVSKYFDRPSVTAHSRCSLLLNTNVWQWLIANFADTYGKKKQMHGCFYTETTGTRLVMLSSKCQTQPPTALVLQWQIHFADTGSRQLAKEGSHCLFISSHTVVTSQFIKQMRTDMCQKQ